MGWIWLDKIPYECYLCADRVGSSGWYEQVQISKKKYKSMFLSSWKTLAGLWAPSLVSLPISHVTPLAMPTQFKPKQLRSRKAQLLPHFSVSCGFERFSWEIAAWPWR
jgi:hypothetical protein